MLLFLTLKHSFYSREIRNFLEMNFTGATIWKNIFTTNKSTVETAWFLKQWSHWCRVLLTHPWKGCSVWLWSWHDIFRNSKAHGVFVECLQFSGMSSVQFSRSVVSYSFRPHESQHARPPSPSPTPRVYPNSCPLSQWCLPPSHPLSSPSPPARNLSQHQGLFKWVSSLHQVAKVLEFQLQHQTFQWTPRTNLL